MLGERIEEVDKYKQTVRDAFDEASAGYDGRALQFFDNTAKYLTELVSLKGHEHVLDICTGTGKVAIEAAQKLKAGSVTGVDISEGMLSRASGKAQKMGLQNIHFKRSDIDHVTFEDKLYDGLFCSFGVHFWENMERSLSHLLKPLKEGAFVAISSFAKGSFEPQSVATLQRFTRYGIKLPATYTWEKLDNESKNAALFRSLGLKDIRHVRAQMGHRLEDTADWWDLVCFTGFRAFLNKMTEEQVDSFKKENCAEIHEMSGGKDISLNVDVIFTLARK